MDSGLAAALRVSRDAFTPLRLPTEHILDVNDSWLHAVGFTREEVIGRTAAELTSGAASRTRHLLVADIAMPEMSGRLLAQELAVRQPQFKTLYISEYPEQAAVHQGVLDDGLAFLSKPFTVEAPFRRIRVTLPGAAAPDPLKTCDEWSTTRSVQRTASISDDASPTPAEPGKAPVLIVEDHADTRTMVETLLRHEGFNVVAAENGQRGLERLQEVRPCLILLDLSMPVLDGWQFRCTQRGLPGVEDVPVLFLTAIPHPDTAAAELGAVGVIRKPVDIDQLLAVVHEHCGLQP